MGFGACRAHDVAGRWSGASSVGKAWIESAQCRMMDRSPVADTLSAASRSHRYTRSRIAACPSRCPDGDRRQPRYRRAPYGGSLPQSGRGRRCQAHRRAEIQCKAVAVKSRTRSGASRSQALPCLERAVLERRHDCPATVLFLPFPCHNVWALPCVRVIDHKEQHDESSDARKSSNICVCHRSAGRAHYGPIPWLPGLGIDGV
jgi:hypothetical protein